MKQASSNRRMAYKISTILLAAFLLLITITNSTVVMADVYGTAPELVSAETDHLGKTITLEFDDSMNDPSGKEGQFDVKVAGTSVPITSTAIGINDNEILLTLDSKITYATSPAAVTVSYTEGDVSSTDGTSLGSFTDSSVTNQTLNLELVDYEPDAVEVACEDDGLGGYIVTYQLRDLMDYDNVNLAMYFYNGYFFYFEENLADYVKFYNKTTGEEVELPNILTEPVPYKEPLPSVDGTRDGRHMFVTDWYFYQIKHRAPLGLELKTRALSPDTTYVIEVLKGFKTNIDTVNNTYKFEFTTTSDSEYKPYWENGSSLTASNVGKTSLDLEWTEASDNHGAAFDHPVSGQYIPNLKYNIYANGTLIDTVDEKTTTYTATNLSKGTEYVFTVEAVDFADNKSEICLETTVTTDNAPELVSAETDHLGKTITLGFDNSMNDPSGKEGQFDVKVAGTSVSIKSTAIGINDNEILLTLDSKIAYATTPSTLTVSYTQGDVSAVNGAELKSFTDSSVTNQTLNLELVDYEPDAVEVACEDDGLGGYTVTYELRDLMDYDNVNLAMYFYNGYFFNFEENLADYVKFYNKATGEEVELPNILTEPVPYSVQLPTDDGTRDGRHMFVTDWYFYQIKHRAPLGLELKTRALSPDTTYVIEVLKGFKTNIDTVNNTYKFEFTTTSDSEYKPYWESGSTLTASNVGKTSLDLEWTEASDNHGAAFDHPVSGQYIPNLKYNIYANGTLIDTVDEKTTTYTATNLFTGTEYLFTVEAVDFADNKSEICLETTVSTKPRNINHDSSAPIVVAEDDSNQSQSSTQDTTGRISTEAMRDDNGNITATVTESQVSEAIKAKAEESGDNGNTAIEITVTAPSDAEAIETCIPKNSVDTMTENGTEMKVSTSIATITFDKVALNTISDSSTEDVKLSISKVDTETLSDEIKETIKDRPVFNFKVTSGEQTISQFGGTAAVSIPYTLKDGEDPNAVIIYYINSEGKLETVKDCVYDSATGMVTFGTTHFSKYAVGYNKVDFADVDENSWYAEPISFITARGIARGTGNGNFSPLLSLTRGQLMVMLMNAYDIMPEVGIEDNFDDAGNTYYTSYLATAKQMGLTVGIGNNLFAPEREITRQEAVTIIYNTLKALGKLPTINGEADLSAYSDSENVSEWAVDSMSLFTQIEIINGINGKLEPAESTTRAQMAQILYKLLTN